MSRWFKYLDAFAAYAASGAQEHDHDRSQETLDAIALRLNMPPRKRFDFKCPIEVKGEVM